MSRKTDPGSREKLLRLVGEGVPVRAAAIAAGIPNTTAARIVNSMPFDGSPQTGPANLPKAQWAADQPVPPARDLKFQTGYHDRTLQAFASPLAFDGWTIERIRRAIQMHDQGTFLESSSLAITVTRFGPVFAALSQAIAPALALPRHVNGGTRGLARILRDEVEDQICPRGGLLPSPYFPPTIWGSTALDLRQMGFSVWQHTYGDEDPETGVRPMYTRRWPTWAIQYYRYRRTYVAITSDGPDDIISGNGKWTLIADTEEPHFDGAIRALGLEVLDGTMAKAARASYLDKYGNPKWVGTLPEGVAVRSDEGNEFYKALSDIRGPDGFGALPYGSKFGIEGLTSSTSTVFKDALDNVWQYCAAILLGSDGTMTRGTGVYSAPIFAGVRRDLVDRMLKAMVRGANMGHIAPWLHFNYAMSIATSAGWVDPVLDIPLPDPDGDARIKSYSDRVKSFHEIIAKERSAGFVVTQERVEQLAKSLDIDPPTLALKSAQHSQLQLAPTDAAKVVRVDEARASQGLDPIGDARGMLMLSEVDAPAKTTAEVEHVANPSAPVPDDATPPQQGPGEMAGDATKDGGTSTGGENGSALSASTGE